MRWLILITKGENRLLFHNGGKKDYVLNTRDPFWCLLEPLCPVIIYNGKLQQLNLGNTLDPLKKKICVSPPEKEPWPAEVLAQDKGNG